MKLHSIALSAALGMSALFAPVEGYSVIITDIPQSDVRRAAEKGDADAQHKLGNVYYWGQGSPVDYAEAVNWFSKAAAQGHAGAQTDLGICYELGQGGNSAAK